MSDFRTKLFGLAGAAMVFAGLAHGQATCTTAGANAVFIRSEGNNEQVADTTITCSVPAANTAVTAGQTATITVYLSPSVTITSYNTGSGNAPKSEAEAGWNATPTTFGGTPINGSISSNSVTFTGIALPAMAAGGAAQTLTITNIKVQASSVASGAGVPTAITETIFMSGTGVVPNVISPTTTVAYVTNGLSGIKASGATSNAICSSVNTYSAAGVAKAANFSIAFGEGFADAFKTQGLAATNATLGSEFTNHTETGYGVTNVSANTATSGTRVKIILNNIPSGVSVFMPITATNNGGIIQMTTSETGAFSAVTGSSANGAPGATSGNTPGDASSALLSVSGGSATVIYETTTASTTGPAVYTLPVYLQASSNALAAPATAITATVSLAPIGAASNVPNFVSGSSTATVNGSTFSACSTTLLFPFVTNQLGFDTGLAISNTSSDLLNGGTRSIAATQSGTCSLTFFGNTAPAAAVVTPTVTAGTAWTNAASVIAPGFQGYVFANCNFLYAHGFAYVVYDLTLNNGAAMGYLADVLPGNRTSPVTSMSATFVAGANVTAGTLSGLSYSSTTTVSANNPESWGH